MPDTISFSRKFLICFTAALICSNTVFRIVNRLSWERGSGPAIAVALAVIILLIGVICPFIWRTRRRSDSTKHRQSVSFWRNLLCYGIAIDLAMIGIQKLFGLQGHVHIALLDSPLSSLSGEDLSWAYYGHSPMYFNCIGLLQVLGALFLVFPRTRLLGVFTLLPILVNICLTGYFYNFYPGEPVHALIVVLGLFYILSEDSRRVLSFFFGSVAPAPAAPQPTPRRSSFASIALRLSVVYIPLLLIIGCFHLPDKDPVHGKYKVTRLWMNNQAADLNSCADSVLTTVYLDEGKDCVFEYNGQQRRLIGDYTIDKGTGAIDNQNDRIKIIWHYPASVHDTLFAQFLPHGPGGPGSRNKMIHLDGRMGRNAVRMDWQKVW